MPSLVVLESHLMVSEICGVSLVFQLHPLFCTFCPAFVQVFAFLVFFLNQKCSQISTRRLASGFSEAPPCCCFTCGQISLLKNVNRVKAVYLKINIRILCINIGIYKWRLILNWNIFHMKTVNVIRYSFVVVASSLSLWSMASLHCICAIEWKVNSLVSKDKWPSLLSTGTSTQTTCHVTADCVGSQVSFAAVPPGWGMKPCVPTPAAWEESPCVD